MKIAEWNPLPPLPQTADAPAVEGAAAAATNLPVQRDSTESNPGVIYHGSEPYSRPSTGYPSGVEVYAQLLATEEEQRNYDKMFEMITWGIGQASDAMRDSYDVAMTIIAPELAAKDWSFSVSNGKLVFIEGEDELTPEELASLRDAFLVADVPAGANEVANTLITALEYERNWGDDLSKGIGRYDVNQKNFADIVNFREYLEHFTAAGKYGEHAINPKRDTAFNILGGMALMEQVAARAEPRFAAPED